MSDWLKPNQDGALIFVRVTPNAKRDGLEAIAHLADGSCVLKARVNAQPEGGRANKALIALLSKASGLAKSAFTVRSGATARSKTIALQANPDDVDFVRKSIEAAIAPD